MAHTETGRITLTTQGQHLDSGIWGAAFRILLDQSECSLVREQAALLLVNLTSQPLPSGSIENSSVWQGPIIRNEDNQVQPKCISLLLYIHKPLFLYLRFILIFIVENYINDKQNKIPWAAELS